MTAEVYSAAYAVVADSGNGQAAVGLNNDRWYQFSASPSELAEAVGRVVAGRYSGPTTSLEVELHELLGSVSGWSPPSAHGWSTPDWSTVRLVGAPGLLDRMRRADVSGLLLRAQCDDSVAPDTDGTVQVIVADGPAPQEWERELRSFTLPQSTSSAIPLYRERGRWLVGPVLRRGGPTIADVLARRTAAEQVRSWPRYALFDGTAFALVNVAVLAWGVSVLVAELVKLTSGRQPRCTWRQLALDPSTYGVSSHLVLPFPDGGNDEPALDVPKIGPRDLVDPQVGIVTRLARITHHPSVPRSLITVHAHTGQVRRVRPWQTDPVTAGTSFSSIGDAELAAIGEAVERYCGDIPQKHLLTRASWNELVDAGVLAPDPERFVLFSPAQHATPGFPFEPLLRDTTVWWVRGECLTRREPALLPASLVYANWRTGPFRDEPNTNNPFYPGVAAGPDLGFAVRAALLEVIERHATMVWWANRHPLPTMRPTGELTAVWEASPLRRWAISIPNEFGIPVIAGFVENHAERLFTAGFAARPDPAAACLKAWAEALTLQDGARDLHDPRGGYRQSVDRGEVNGQFLKPWRADRRYLDDYAADFRDIPDLMCQLQYYLDPRAVDAIRDLTDRPVGLELSDVPAHAGGSDDLLSAVADRGYDVYCADITTPDVRIAGQRVVRILVPGLVPNYAAAFPFLGHRRLAKAAVELGWRTEALPDAALNLAPIPHA